MVGFWDLEGVGWVATYINNFQHQTHESKTMQAMNSFQSTGENGASSGEHMSHSHFDPSSSHDDFLQQILSSVPSSSPWPEISGDGHPYNFDDHQSTLLASKLRQHQINGGTSAAAAAKALMLQQQLLLSRGIAGNGGSGINGDQNDDGLNSVRFIYHKIQFSTVINQSKLITKNSIE